MVDMSTSDYLVLRLMRLLFPRVAVESYQRAYMEYRRLLVNERRHAAKARAFQDRCWRAVQRLEALKQSKGWK